MYLALLVALDLALLLIVLLVLSFYGMSHLMIFLLGIIILALALIDLRSAFFSTMFSKLLGLDGPGELRSIKWLPVIMAALLLGLSLPVVIEHGVVNETQRWAMQHGQLIRVALPAAVGGVAVMLIAVWTIVRGKIE